jgi:hypothetical protein
VGFLFSNGLRAGDKKCAIFKKNVIMTALSLAILNRVLLTITQEGD